MYVAHLWTAKCALTLLFCSTRWFPSLHTSIQCGFVQWSEWYGVCLTECQDMFHKFLTFQLLADPVSCILLPPSLLSSLLPFPLPFSFSFFLLFPPSFSPSSRHPPSLLPLPLLLSSFCKISGAVVLLLVITIGMFIHKPQCIVNNAVKLKAWERKPMAIL